VFFLQASAMPMSALQVATRAFAKVLVALASKYDVTVSVNRDSDDASFKSAFLKLVRRAHPDKGGSEDDAKSLHAARDDWAAAKADAAGRGRPRSAGASDSSNAKDVPDCGVIARPGAAKRGAARNAYRIQSEGVMLTYMSIKDLLQWRRLVSFVKSSIKRWGVKNWCLTFEKCPTTERLHAHAYIQFLSAVDRTAAGFAFENIKPNASTCDYCGEGLSRKRMQDSINRGFFYVWADKIDTVRSIYG